MDHRLGDMILSAILWILFPTCCPPSPALSFSLSLSFPPSFALPLSFSSSPSSPFPLTPPLSDFKVSYNKVFIPSGSLSKICLLFTRFSNRLDWAFFNLFCVCSVDIAAAKVLLLFLITWANRIYFWTLKYVVMK